MSEGLIPAPVPAPVPERERLDHPRAAAFVREPAVGTRAPALLLAGTGLVVFGLMVVLGLLMRMSQAEWIALPADWFYRVLTLHGAGMLVGMLLAMMGALVYSLGGVVRMERRPLLAAWGFIVGGAGAVIVATLVGGFAAAWTFLYPLPFDRAREWPLWSTELFLAGLVLVAVGWGVYCLDLLWRLLATHGGLLRALGIPYLLRREQEAPPPQVLAATVVLLVGLLSNTAGATVVLAELVPGAIDRGAIDNLWAKNLTYFFGHAIMNLLIYMAAAALYVILPRYAGRPWKTSRPLVVGWLGTLVFVVTAYPHHLYMDFVQPGVLHYVGLVGSSGAAVPVAVVTVYTGLMLVWGSRFRWTLASTLLYIGFAGWLIGGIAAVLDSSIALNVRLHNTLWVPGHFHTYLLLGVAVWAFAFVAHVLEQAAGRPARPRVARAAVALIVVGGYGLVAMWYVSGALGVPRRYAVHPDGTAGYSAAAAAFVLVLVAGLVLLVRELVALAQEARQEGVALVPRLAAWDGFSYVARRRHATGGAPAPAPAPVAPPLPSRRAADVVAAVGLVALVVVLMPPLLDAAIDGAASHHAFHVAEFACGAAIGAALASHAGVFSRLAALPPLPVIVALVALDAAMLLVMTPAVYDGVDPYPLLHGLYHVGMAGLGLATAVLAARLGRTPGLAVVALSALGGLLWAPGVS